jgi:ERCC4-type nuclease
VVIDSDEKLPYTFLGIKSDARAGGRVLAVPLMRRSLRTGDYSLRGYESRVAVERKSLQDLYGTLGRRRACFERELARLNEMEFACVVVEANWETILCDPPERSQLRPKVVYRSVLAWQQRFVRVHWLMMGSRRLAEVTTLRVLDRFWRDHQ